MIVLRGAALLVLVLGLAQADLAITLKEYRERVRTAIGALQKMRAEQQITDNSGFNENLEVVRASLPRRDVVDWNGTKFMVDNSWIDDQLKESERAGASQSTRAAALDRTLERLRGLDKRLNDVEKESTPKLHDPQMRSHLNSILQRSEYAKIVKEESALSRLWKRIVRFLDSLIPKPKSINGSRINTVSRIAQISVILLAAGAIGYALWMFLPKFVKRRRTQKPVKAKARVVLGERLEPDQSAADLLLEAEALARTGDLRGAIRRAYIALLVELSERKLISLAQHKTNRDYLRAVKASAALHQSMESLTNNFELHWYVLVPAAESDWLAFRAGYQKALS